MTEHDERLSREDLEALTDELGDYVAGLPGQPRQVEIREAFPLWTVQRRTESGACKLEQAATPTHRWHLQLHFDGKPEGYAVLECSDDGPRVQGVSVGPLARKIAKGVRELDRLFPHLTGARLLDVPGNALHALWFTPRSSGAPCVMLLDAPSAYHLRRFSVHSEADFIKQLEDVRENYGTIAGVYRRGRFVVLFSTLFGAVQTLFGRRGSPVRDQAPTPRRLV